MIVHPRGWDLHVTAPTAGTCYVMLRAFQAYCGVTLTGRYNAAPAGDPYLTNRVPVTGLSGAMSSQKFWRIAVPAGRQLTIRTSGGSGDADLYVRRGNRPTVTAYDCRSYLNANNEVCTINTIVAADYYILVLGYRSYTGVTLTATY